ncbi:unnamed protein product, partial [Effrenium voratum]
DYRDFCVQFLQRMEPRPEILLALPPPAYENDLEIQQDVVNTQLPSAIRRVAEAAASVINTPMEEQARRGRTTVPPELLARASVLDTFALLGGEKLSRPSYFADGIHPNERGTKLLGLSIFAELRAKVSKYLRKRADEAAKEVPDNPLGL